MIKHQRAQKLNFRGPVVPTLCKYFNRTITDLFEQLKMLALHRQSISYSTPC